MRSAQIMLVEDERIVAMHLRQQLIRLGYQVTGTAASGVQALRQLDRLRPDIVLMDIHIEGDMDGIETASHIPREYGIPVVYLTAYSEEATLERARATRPYGYLLKPFAERELHATIQMVLERRQTELALEASQQELREAQETLERRVAERTAELAEANDRLQHAYEEVERQSIELAARADDLAEARARAEAVSAAKSRFLATMSHELRTPLTGLIGFAELLLRKDFPARDRRRFLEMQCESARALLALVNDILDLSKIEAGRVDLAETPFELRAVVSGCSALASLQAESKGLAFEIAVADDAPAWLVGDPIRLRQIILNLLVNAIKFTERGRVFLTVAPEGERLRYAVIDTGSGIPADQLGLLFRQFSQLGDADSRRYGGTGLGLAICREIVSLMGGEIGVESVEGQGSEFWFKVPMRIAATETAAPASLSPARERPRRVLLVEDDPVIQILIQTALEVAGHEVTLAADGIAAVEKALAGGFDVILTDLQMPLLDGVAAARRIRAAETDGNRVPIVAFTANACEAEIERCRAAGMDAFLAKPVDLDQLLAMIDELSQSGETERAPLT